MWGVDNLKDGFAVEVCSFAQKILENRVLHRCAFESIGSRKDEIDIDPFAADGAKIELALARFFGLLLSFLDATFFIDDQADDFSPFANHGKLARLPFFNLIQISLGIIAYGCAFLFGHSIFSHLIGIRRSACH